MTDTIVFDTEPLVADLDDEPGNNTVEEWIDRVASGEIEGYISPVTKTEVLYVGSRVGFRPADVRASLERLEELGVTVFDPRECWDSAAALKEAYTMALGDAYALATADAVDGTLLVGADDDSDEVEDDTVRFRNEPA
ncbi:PIN domain-containing protein [Natrinema hispanicum]|uniref:Predicted nucleic acid-binding protein, contains PIN domain n=1 Tax=Natrinema hispanicum TaxID=392421 RepID=A0A1I0JN48_9EURY|nr:PIN domain-containing protein [Natrinema hispanicum]SDD97695.1 Predicted nucleic acid-binding protein, contains PIN domain [Natrinema hispanicum]SEU11859.1 Predicted nucleic acid-binding protein, contains PIN domain [Natrinema hispanicum]